MYWGVLLLLLVSGTLGALDPSQIQPICRLSESIPHPAWNCSNVTNACDWPMLNCTPSGFVTTLSLSYAQSFFVASIPTEVGLLTYLAYLSIDTYNLVGTLPSQIGNLRQLAFLNLNSNYLRGTLPTELALAPLVILTMYGNQVRVPCQTELINFIQQNLFQDSFFFLIDSNLFSFQEPYQHNTQLLGLS